MKTEKLLKRVLKANVEQLIESCNNDFNLASSTIETAYNKGLFTETERGEYLDMLAEEFIAYNAQKGGLL